MSARCTERKQHEATVDFAEGALAMVHGFIERLCRCCYFKRVEKAFNEVKANYDKLKADTSPCE